MATDHRVAGHLGVAADKYDRAIRTFVFARPECFWKLGGQSVFGAFRDGAAAETSAVT